MRPKISIIGTGGVGSTLAFNVLSKLNIEELVLVDVNSGLAKGVALDLEDTRGMLDFSAKISAGNKFSLIKNSDVVVLTAGIARKKGMSRLDLFKINTSIAKKISEKIKKLSPNCMIVVITNPLDIITYTVTKYTKFPRHRVMGMGSSLDTSRLLNILYNKTKISPSSIEGFVFGFHNKNMFVKTSRMRIQGLKLSSYLKTKEIKDIEKKVQMRGAEIVSLLKTKSANFSPALACFNLLKAILCDEGRIIPLSVLLKGEYGVNGVCLGVPCLVNRKGVAEIIDIGLTAAEKRKVEKTKEILKNV
ncbi:MAG: malate dehydrogenase [Candidatus Omnitrophica bacterium]|nr:malate dehydrogenase [Candidatus Omnitrophota bacterium]MBD3268778.1 malate dehydrogenase [Candidatus Omnitrophota bacterium]